MKILIELILLIIEKTKLKKIFKIHLKKCSVYVILCIICFISIKNYFDIQQLKEDNFVYQNEKFIKQELYTQDVNQNVASVLHCSLVLNGYHKISNIFSTQDKKIYLMDIVCYDIFKRKNNKFVSFYDNYNNILFVRSEINEMFVNFHYLHSFHSISPNYFCFSGYFDDILKIGNNKNQKHTLVGCFVRQTGVVYVFEKNDSNSYTKYAQYYNEIINKHNIFFKIKYKHLI